MKVELIGGPKDGEVLEIPDEYDCLSVPVTDANRCRSATGAILYETAVYKLTPLLRKNGNRVMIMVARK